MMKAIELDDIVKNLDLDKNIAALIQCQKTAFEDYASGRYHVPLPMQFIFPEYASDFHLKASAKEGSDQLIVKIAHGNPSGGEGMIFCFSAQDGTLKFLLNEKGYLTTLRTALGGLAVCECFPWNIGDIGIIGSGHVARCLYQVASARFPSANIRVYARNPDKAKKITDNVCDSVSTLMDSSDVVFTATASAEPLVHAFGERANQAIIALGSDDPYKSEISASLYREADLIIVDSVAQASKYGDAAKALKHGIIQQDALVEFGALANQGFPNSARKIIADFSGIGPQDFAIADFVLNALTC